VVDDPSINWRERLILDVLTSEQARQYYQGTSPKELVLESGQTLAEYLAARTNPAGSVYVPLPGTCELFSIEDLLPDESLGLEVRGQCGIPEEATAVILQVKAESLGGSPRVKIWASDLPEPAEAVIEGSNASFENLKVVTAVVMLCAGDPGERGDLWVNGTDAGKIHAEAVGYFRLLSASDGAEAGSSILFSTESTSNNFFGTGAGSSNTTGNYNSFFGGSAGDFNTTGSSNSFFGYVAGYSNSTGNHNAFFGRDAGYSNTEGDSNAFFGSAAGRSNTTGHDNVFFGRSAGYFNSTGHYNAFFGRSAGHFNTFGDSNAFFGHMAGYSNTVADASSFFGYRAGYSNTSGYFNAFFGYQSGTSNTTGQANSFFGYLAGFSNTTGNYNSFFGGYAGDYNTTGNSNVFIGDSAGRSNTVEDKNTFIGGSANLDPGSDPGTSPVTNATAIGYQSYVSQSNSLVLGSINGVNGAAATTQVGIGTTAPQRLLHIVGDNAVFRMDRGTNSAAFMIVRTNSLGSVLKNFVVGVDASGVNQGEFIINDLGTAVGGPGQRRLTINNDGDVIINGDLITNAGPLSFPDYVFAEDYELMPLGELSEYVEAERHLPEIPSSEEIQQQGEINVTELQLKLLQKVEELTLYTIEQQTTIEQLREQNSQLSAQLIEQNRLVNARLEVLERTDSPDR
jgi:hypothetical protein